MNTDSIPIPAERIPPVALDMAGTSKSYAGVLLFMAAVFALATLGASEKRDREDNSGAYAAGRIVGMLLVVGTPAMFGYRHARNASRATKAATLARSGPSYSWRLAGKWLLVVDRDGAPRPDLSFKLSGKLRGMLLAVPRADITNPPPG